MQKDIKQTWRFSQPAQEVWACLTQPELLEQWLMKSDFKPVVGHHFRFTHDPKNDSCYAGVTECEVLEVIPFVKLSYSWKGSTKDGNRAFKSTVVWTLIPQGNETELRLQHHGFALLEDALAHEQGWSACIKRFEELLSKPMIK
jgi:uncharacterized protein YndB with AHSA1/START domain